MNKQKVLKINLNLNSLQMFLFAIESQSKDTKLIAEDLNDESLSSDKIECESHEINTVIHQSRMNQRLFEFRNTINLKLHSYTIIFWISNTNNRDLISDSYLLFALNSVRSE